MTWTATDDDVVDIIKHTYILSSENGTVHKFYIITIILSNWSANINQKSHSGLV